MKVSAKNVIVSMLTIVFILTLFAEMVVAFETSSQIIYIDYEISLNISLDGVQQRTLTFGMSKQTNDLFDNGIDEIRQSSGQDDFDAYFSENDASPKNKLTADFKEMANEKNWILVAIAPKNQIVNITWNSSDINANISLKIGEIETGAYQFIGDVIDMKQYSFISIHGNSSTPTTKIYKIVLNGNIETCNDGIQNQGEIGIDCGGPCIACQSSIPPQTVPTGSSGSSSNSGVPPQKVCNETWICTEWSACDGEVQIRTCSDSKSCNTIKNKPAESQPCSVPKSTENITSQEISSNENREKITTKIIQPTGFFLGPSENYLLIIVTIIFLIIIFSITRKD
jgi:hypothetical protein